MKRLESRVKIENIKTKSHRFLFGVKENDGFLLKLMIYTLLIAIGFVYLFPVLFMLSNSFMPLSDLVNSMVKWVPSSLDLENYKKAFKVLKYKDTLLQTFIVAGIPSITQTIAAAIVGYGFARFSFPGKKILFVIMLATFIVPPQVTMMPTYLLFKKYELLGSITTFIYPAILGQGLKSALFILIFYQFFRKVPIALEEAAQLDGAGHFQIFYRIGIPNAIPGFVIVFLFSFVWYWNETYLAGMYFGNSMTTLPLELQKFSDSYSKMYPPDSPANQLNEAIKLAGTLVTIAPLLVLYFVLQRWFVESVDRSGITGE